MPKSPKLTGSKVRKSTKPKAKPKAKAKKKPEGNLMWKILQQKKEMQKQGGVASHYPPNVIPLDSRRGLVGKSSGYSRFAGPRRRVG